MKKYRLLSLIMMVMLLLTAASGCGSKKSSSDGPDTDRAFQCVVSHRARSNTVGEKKKACPRGSHRRRCS